MMKRTLTTVALLALGIAGTANAASFVNGGFETGDYSGWTQGAGFNSGPTANSDGSLALDPAAFLPDGTRHNASYWQGTITSAGTDPITGLDTVRYGNHSVRINNAVNDYSVNVLTQTVQNYDGDSINFSWAAVLEASHGITDSTIFGLKVTDLTTNSVLYNVTYSSANTNTSEGLFSVAFNNWYYTQWIDVSLAVTQGNDFEISLLAADCPYSGHEGYVYLDGFGTVSGGPGDGNDVPEPGSLALLGLGLLGVIGLRRRVVAA